MNASLLWWWWPSFCLVFEPAATEGQLRVCWTGSLAIKEIVYVMEDFLVACLIYFFPGFWWR